MQWHPCGECAWRMHGVEAPSLHSDAALAFAAGPLATFVNGPDWPMEEDARGEPCGASEGMYFL